jgi:hypothetical protein
MLGVWIESADPPPADDPSALLGTALLAAADPSRLTFQPVGKLKTAPLTIPDPDREKPLLMVDIDGVISLFGSPSPIGGPAGGDRRPGAAAPAGTLHSIDGTPHFLSATAAAHLLSLAEDFELVWASGWEERADEHLPRLLGLPGGLPFLRFERSPGRGHAHWKLEAIEEFAGMRPLAWIDDAFNEACHEWARERRAPTLLVRTQPELGLTAGEAEQLRAWARGRAAA